MTNVGFLPLKIHKEITFDELKKGGGGGQRMGVQCERRPQIASRKKKVQRRTELPLNTP